MYVEFDFPFLKLPSETDFFGVLIYSERTRRKEYETRQSLGSRDVFGDGDELRC